MRNKKTVAKYTLVLHSGFGYGGNIQFERAVENHFITTERDARKVRMAGGVLFDNYTESADAEYAANYPPHVKGLIPDVPGTFSKYEVDGLKIYVPPPQPPKAA